MGKFIDELCNVLAFIDSNYQAKSVYIHVWRYEHYFVFIVQMLTYTDLCELASPLWLDTFATQSDIVSTYSGNLYDKIWSMFWVFVR